IRRLLERHTDVTKFYTEMQVLAIRKYGMEVGLPVPISFLQSGPFVHRTVSCQILWVRRHARHPHPSLRFKGNGHRISNGKIKFRSKEFYFIALREDELRFSFFQLLYCGRHRLAFFNLMIKADDLPCFLQICQGSWGTSCPY